MHDGVIHGTYSVLKQLKDQKQLLSAALEKESERKSHNANKQKELTYYSLFALDSLQTSVSGSSGRALEPLLALPARLSDRSCYSSRAGKSGVARVAGTAGKSSPTAVSSGPNVTGCTNHTAKSFDALGSRAAGKADFAWLSRPP